ncbi:helix-turn-helix transcriptional regulator [Niabella beijingensis]|uniref:helix-turn-helix transcriptional regulator n=1 Tax=Niabella beijingensis TaxID=2872700 RepID=UPI001CBFC914|nr:helix-turn-helix domain-containing protein [Niabella beijingensis]MBZ4189401.1 helix-turn-helix transcriptional regulator [Niabella beijingensis]
MVIVQQPGVPFLGNNQFARSVGDSIIALTHYSSTAVFEEWHAHTTSSISFLLYGTYEEHLLGMRYKRMPGDIKYVPFGEAHRCVFYTPGTRAINLNLTPSLLKQLDLADNKIMQVLHDFKHTKFALVKLFKELLTADESMEAVSQLTLHQLFYPGILSLKKYNQPPRWVIILKEILHDEWNTSYELNDLANRCGVHRITISRYFHQYFSITLGRYIHQIRIDKAMSMIKATSLSLTDIAYKCGFADQAHFTRTFKNITGFLPRDFRKI